MSIYIRLLILATPTSVEEPHRWARVGGNILSQERLCLLFIVIEFAQVLGDGHLRNPVMFTAKNYINLRDFIFTNM